MSLLIYTLSVRFYQWLLWLIAPFHAKARQWTDGRKQILKRLKKAFANNTAPVAWFHAASLGEFEQGRPVIEAYRAAYPTHKILLTFFSPSGYEVRKNYPGADYIFYLPVDTAHNAQQFIDMVKPTIAFFVKYEFWYHYLQALHKQQISIISFSSIFRPSQLFFKPYGGFYRNLLHYFDHLFVQNEISSQLLANIGLTRVSVAGDTRFDRVRQVCEAKKAIPLAERFKNNRKLLVIGSGWPADMEVLLPFLNRFDGELKVIIAPHEIHENELQALQQSLKKKSVRYSQANETTVAEADVLIIDNIGMLSSLYQYGEFAYIGGAFGKGLHNILEAATFGMPLFFGPNHQRFQEAIDLIGVGAAFSIQQTGDFENAFTTLYFNEKETRVKAEITQQYVVEHTGATLKVMEYVKQIHSCNS
ncbi:MAG: glycosyltransferase N-terminal domain-containing protein [Bacteroidota bacterium]